VAAGAVATAPAALQAGSLLPERSCLVVLFVAASVKEIARLGTAYPWNKPSCCPRCGGRLWWHGFVVAWFSCRSHCVYLRRLFCSQCRAVHRLKPQGYWPRYRSSSAEIHQVNYAPTEHGALAARPAALAPTPVVASAGSDDSAGLRDVRSAYPPGRIHSTHCTKHHPGLPSNTP
jgi:hypothetical protein